MSKIIFYPNKNIMHQERVLKLEFLEDGAHVCLKTEVEFPEIAKGKIRNYPKWPIPNLSLKMV